MLPILRILPVGGVLLAIILLVLALNPPDGSHMQLKANGTLARGALIDQTQHPEWRLFLMLAAIRRADELKRLRELLDTPKLIGLPASRSDSDPDDEQTGSIVQAPPATIPIEIGAPSSTELPVAAPEERPPMITPKRVKSRNESRIKAPQRTRHVKLRTKPDAPGPFNLFGVLFDAQPVKQPPTIGANADVH